MSRIPPKYVFDDAAEYYRRHSEGVLREFEKESQEINEFNRRQHQFKAWVLARLYQTKQQSYWAFLVRPGEQAEFLFPREGETCEIQLWSRSGKEKRSEKLWEAERIENPAASFGVPEGETHRMPAFKVKVPKDVPEDTLRPLQDDPDEVGYDAPNKLSKNFAFGDKKSVRITMKLRLSSATKDAEFGALNKLFMNPDGEVTPKQAAAFEYLLNFKKVPLTVNIFNHFPHLRDPINNPGGMPPKVVTMLKGFNQHQRDAYRNVLSALPCGIGVIPGGPGAGKTHWNLVLTAAIQSKNIIYHGPDNVSNRSAKVLYILDINKPLDDTCNKIVRLYKSLGLKKYAVRLHGWRYSIRSSEKPDFSNKFMFMARVNKYKRQTTNEGCLAPSLDELVWDFYQSNKTTRYRELYDLVTRSVKNGKNSGDLKALVGQLYQDVLDQVDFIATTPVPAATAFNGLYKPDIVIFDESPHAREASTMVAIAQYEPIAWIFSGDHRQTRPFVASDDYRDNPWAPQMLVSMMERADRAGVIRQSLLINHRAYGGLQQLASNMFYKGKMITGHKEAEMYPPSVRHTQRYIERFLSPGQRCWEPRLIAFDGRRSEVRVGTSWYNSSHINWVMERVSELLPDPMFRQVGKNERGTILIISPYKESYMKYKRAIKDLPGSWQTRLNVEGRVEARTIDTVQGGEADFVFLDLVRSDATEFTDDPNRLNVALTRARQAEVIMMHPGMRRNTFHLSRIFNHCNALGQVVEITDRRPRQMSQVPIEERAYKEHIAYQRQFDRQRAEYGLDVGATYIQDEGAAIVKDGDAPEADNEVPKSIYADQFASLAAFMEDILQEKRRGGKSKDQSLVQSLAPKAPAAAHESQSGSSKQHSREDHGQARRAVTAQSIDDSLVRSQGIPAESSVQLSTGLVSKNHITSPKAPGLLQSCWNTQVHRIAAPSTMKDAQRDQYHTPLPHSKTSTPATLQPLSTSQSPNLTQASLSDPSVSVPHSHVVPYANQHTNSAQAGPSRGITTTGNIEHVTTTAGGGARNARANSKDKETTLAADLPSGSSWW